MRNLVRDKAHVLNLYRNVTFIAEPGRNRNDGCARRARMGAHLVFYFNWGLGVKEQIKQSCFITDVYVSAKLYMVNV